MNSQTCFHCKTPIPQAEKAYELQEGSATHSFCCIGCLSVWQIIHGQGLDSYYERRELTGKEIPVGISSRNYEQYDSPGIQERFVKNHADGKEVHLVLQGIHCSACIWLIERYLLQHNGIKQVSVNLGTERVRVVWDGSVVPLSGVIRYFAEIGYQAAPYDPFLVEHQRQFILRSFLLKLAVAAFSAGNIMMLSFALYAGYFSGIEQEFKVFFEWISLVLSLPAICYSALPFWQGAWHAIRFRQPNMDFLIAAGISITFSSSVVILLTDPTQNTYFDSCVMIIFFLLIGRTLERLTRSQVVNLTERLLTLSPRFVTRLEQDGTQVVIPQQEVKHGDILFVREGEQLPVDGKVVTGESELDESAITGEPQWRYVKVNDTVIGGSTCRSGNISIKTTAVGHESLLHRIVDLVEKATARKTRLQSMADRLASKFVWMVLALTTGTWIFWTWNGTEAHPWMIAVSVIIIACPCALGLATPAAILVAVGSAIRRGILVKDGDALEQAALTSDIIFDKTGTLTTGQMQVIHLDSFTEHQEEWLPAVFQMEACSNHPVAKALSAYLRQHFPELDRGGETDVSFKNFPGRGISGQFEQQQVLIGNQRLMVERQVDLTFPTDTIPVMFPEIEVLVALNGQLAGRLILRDKIKSEAPSAVARLKKMGLDVHILSGDRQLAVDQLAWTLGIQKNHGELLPDKKLEYIESLQKDHRVVVMVGDGINDAPSLKQSNMGIAMASGTDISVDAANVVLTRSHLEGVCETLLLARKTRRIIRQNLAISLTYNALTIPLAMMGWINPLFSALTMAFSSLFVTLNALRLKSFDQ
ncbi:MAG: heavy metal translocating P-type ATPase [SAR324 cluster bacterium]|nr:heavy metal translocating P-type ATPase [SAR324 cluster bacterium]